MGDISLTVVNPAVQLPESQATVYQGVSATLSVALANNTGADISLTASAPASSLEIFMPSFYTFAEVQLMQISLSGWTFSPDTSDESLMLTYTGAGAGVW